eukprot:TRINITY_DN9417_c1_g1_i1.p5 TRINITY_DN9417_c1_g1~~TRINITY_DN9417_c1_g1_i1.p5  ORF type:complete len:104 (-),score=6.19 TRINITY_DN9417_c1_g1_i1:535-822(-)
MNTEYYVTFYHPLKPNGTKIKQTMKYVVSQLLLSWSFSKVSKNQFVKINYMLKRCFNLEQITQIIAIQLIDLWYFFQLGRGAFLTFDKVQKTCSL